MAEQEIPKRAPGSTHNGQEPWTSDPSTVERRDIDRPESGADAEAVSDADHEEEIVNRTGAGFATRRRYEEPAEHDIR